MEFMILYDPLMFWIYTFILLNMADGVFENELGVKK